MKLVSAETMRHIDNSTIKDCGIPGSVLMENAGHAIAREAEKILGYTCGKVIHVFCGHGNNGGDGYVAARHLINGGATVNLYACSDPNKLKGDAKHAAKWFNLCDHTIETIENENHLKKISKADLIIDALLGTGIQGPVKGFFKTVIEWVNQQDAPVLSVDIPSGIMANCGELSGPCIRAHTSVTMGWPKIGMAFHPAKTFVGRLIVESIGFPWPKLYDQDLKIEQDNQHALRKYCTQRNANDHKNHCGKCLVIAGSIGMTGAASLCSLATLRSGAGLVQLACPSSLNSIYEQQLMEVMTIPVDDQGQGYFSPACVEALSEKIKWANVIAIGPGLGREKATLSFLHDLISQINRPIVLDADGLFAFNQDLSLLKNHSQTIVITPHTGEFERLFNLKLAPAGLERIQQVQEKAQDYGLIIHLKGSPSITASPDGRVFVNEGGNPGMATGGSGDVLTGCITAFIGQGMEALHATRLAAWLHAKAGDLSADSIGEHSMIASDIIKNIPQAFQELKS